jgi:hypothetical protein
MKNITKNWLEILEKANKSSFGSEPLDCCTIGRNKNEVKSINVNNKRK